MKTIKLFTAALVTFTANSALAQDIGVGASASADTAGNAESEVVSLEEIPEEEAAAPAEQTAAPPQESSAPTNDEDGAGSKEGEDEAGEEEQSDHEKVVGRFAVGYLGRQTLHYGAATNTPVAAPIVGVRYWINPLVGIDGGVGLNFLGGKAKTTDLDDVKAAGHSAVLVHLGVPLSLASKGHFSFQVVPEMNLGFVGTGDQNPLDNVEQTSAGNFFNIGAKVGAELHFGFMGIPQLSLQGNVGVYVQAETVSDKVVTDGNEVKTSVSYTSFGSTLGPDPWDIFTSSVSALYYF